MPTEVTLWKCNDCGITYTSGAAAEACESYHALIRITFIAACSQYSCTRDKCHGVDASVMPCRPDCRFADRGPHACTFSIRKPATVEKAP